VFGISKNLKQKIGIAKCIICIFDFCHVLCTFLVFKVV
jgi:hypothetical protein